MNLIMIAGAAIFAIGAMFQYIPKKTDEKKKAEPTPAPTSKFVPDVSKSIEENEKARSQFEAQG